MRNNSKVDLNIEEAFRRFLLPPRDLKVVSVSSYLKGTGNYNKDLTDSIYYSIITPPPLRYYYSWVRQRYPKLCLEMKALHINRVAFIIDYEELYQDHSKMTPTLTKLKEEIIMMIKVKV